MINKLVQEWAYLPIGFVVCILFAILSGGNPDAFQNYILIMTYFMIMDLQYSKKGGEK